MIEFNREKCKDVLTDVKRTYGVFYIEIEDRLNKNEKEIFNFFNDVLYLSRHQFKPTKSSLPWDPKYEKWLEMAKYLEILCT